MEQLAQAEHLAGEDLLPRAGGEPGGILETEIRDFLTLTWAIYVQDTRDLLYNMSVAYYVHLYVI